MRRKSLLAGLAALLSSASIVGCVDNDSKRVDEYSVYSGIYSREKWKNSDGLERLTFEDYGVPNSPGIIVFKQSTLRSDGSVDCAPCAAQDSSFSLLAKNYGEYVGKDVRFAKVITGPIAERGSLSFAAPQETDFVPSYGVASFDGSWHFMTGPLDLTELRSNLPDILSRAGLPADKVEKIRAALPPKSFIDFSKNVAQVYYDRSGALPVLDAISAGQQVLGMRNDLSGEFHGWRVTYDLTDPSEFAKIITHSFNPDSKDYDVQESVARQVHQNLEKIAHISQGTVLTAEIAESVRYLQSLDAGSRDVDYAFGETMASRNGVNFTERLSEILTRGFLVDSYSSSPPYSDRHDVLAAFRGLDKSGNSLRKRYLDLLSASEISATLPLYPPEVQEDYLTYAIGSSDMKLEPVPDTVFDTFSGKTLRVNPSLVEEVNYLRQANDLFKRARSGIDCVHLHFPGDSDTFGLGEGRDLVFATQGPTYSDFAEIYSAAARAADRGIESHIVYLPRRYPRFSYVLPSGSLDCMQSYMPLSASGNAIFILNNGAREGITLQYSENNLNSLVN